MSGERNGIVPSSPRIEKLRWGRIEVAGGWGPFKDAKLYPGGAREWDWRETDTDHDPGIQPTDVEELLEHGATVVVLSQGMHKRLRVPSETLEMLEARGIPAHVLPTEDAVALYNELRESAAVGGLFHSTC
ncbi:MAG: Mth938-like domain-containing protein [Gemmatimonadales bacterium]